MQVYSMTKYGAVFWENVRKHSHITQQEMKAWGHRWVMQYIDRKFSMTFVHCNIQIRYRKFYMTCPYNNDILFDNGMSSNYEYFILLNIKYNFSMNIS